MHGGYSPEVVVYHAETNKNLTKRNKKRIDKDKKSQNSTTSILLKCCLFFSRSQCAVVYYVMQWAARTLLLANRTVIVSWHWQITAFTMHVPTSARTPPQLVVRCAAVAVRLAIPTSRLRLHTEVEIRLFSCWFHSVSDNWSAYCFFSAFVVDLFALLNCFVCI